MIKKWRVPEAAIGFFISRLAKDGPSGANVASVFIFTVSVNAPKTAFLVIPTKNSQRK
jgi:hypothetical protein